VRTVRAGRHFRKIVCEERFLPQNGPGAARGPAVRRRRLGGLRCAGSALLHMIIRPIRRLHSGAIVRADDGNRDSRLNKPRLSERIYKAVSRTPTDRQADLIATARTVRQGLCHLGMEQCRLGADNEGGYFFTHGLNRTSDSEPGTLLLVIPGSGSTAPGCWSTLAFCKQVGCERGSGELPHALPGSGVVGVCCQQLDARI
jgi:hypothetical protein